MECYEKIGIRDKRNFVIEFLEMVFHFIQEIIIYLRIGRRIFKETTVVLLYLSNNAEVSL